jgi:hypothetical protein
MVISVDRGRDEDLGIGSKLTFIGNCLGQTVLKIFF